MADGARAKQPFAFLITDKGQQAGIELAAIAQGALTGRLRVEPWWSSEVSGSATVQLVVYLRDAAIVLADLRVQNTNVYYEVGVAHALGTPVLCIANDPQEVSFDLRDQNLLIIPRHNGIINQEQLAYAIQTRVSAALVAPPETPVSLVRSQPGSNGPAQEGTLWRDLAMTGRLPGLSNTDVDVDTQVVHVRHGIGHIIGFTTDGGPVVRVTVRFARRVIEFDTDDAKLFLAEVHPAPNGRPGA